VDKQGKYSGNYLYAPSKRLLFNVLARQGADSTVRGRGPLVRVLRLKRPAEPIEKTKDHLFSCYEIKKTHLGDVVCGLNKSSDLGDWKAFVVFVFDAGLWKDVIEKMDVTM
jgi:hypothetical protein